jgi:hypothetical protein
LLTTGEAAAFAGFSVGAQGREEPKVRDTHRPPERVVGDAGPDDVLRVAVLQPAVVFAFCSAPADERAVLADLQGAQPAGAITYVQIPRRVGLVPGLSGALADPSAGWQFLLAHADLLYTNPYPSYLLIQ